MSHGMQKWAIVLRGTDGIVEIVLKDRDGWRASRVLHDGAELLSVLDGWEQEYDCATDMLLVAGLTTASHEIWTTVNVWVEELPLEQKPTCRLVDPEAVMEALDRGIGQNGYRPKPIRELKREIAEETRLAEFMAMHTGEIETDRIHKIVDLRLQLDRLYGDWMEQRIS